MNTLDLIKVAKECPGLKVEISIGDFIEANMLLIAEVKRELEQTIADEKAETYLSREKVMEMLDIASTTLWRTFREGSLVAASRRSGQYTQLFRGARLHRRYRSASHLIRPDRLWQFNEGYVTTTNRT